jgi:hypothetical protein
VLLLLLPINTTTTTTTATGCKRGKTALRSGQEHGAQSLRGAC